MSAKVYDASDDLQIQAKRRGLKREDRDFLAVINTIEGRRLLWSLLSQCGVFQTSMTFATAETLGRDSAVFFNEGRRNVGLKILADINRLSPDSYGLMMKENKEVEDE